jgi:hypothetical protein
MKLRVSIATGALLLAPTLATVSAHAQSDNGKYAETAFNEGRSYFEKGNIAAACAKFQKSLDLDFQRTTLQALSVCREKEEKWASAWNNYLELARRFSQAGEEDKARLARSKASELEKKLLYIVLVMDEPPPGLDITVDGTKLDASLLGTRLPVDPGQHEVVVTAKKKKPWKQKVNVGPSPVEQQVRIAKLEDDPNAEAAASSAQYQLPGPMREAPGFWTTQRIVGASVGAAGILALGGGAVFQIIALSEDSKRKGFESQADGAGQPTANPCVGNNCNFRDAQYSRESAASNDQIGAIVLASAGGAMLITGIVLLATGGAHTASAGYKPAGKGLLADLTFTPTASPRAVGLVGTF